MLNVWKNNYCRDCVLLLLYLKSVIKLLKHETKWKVFMLLLNMIFDRKIAPAMFCFCLLLLLIIVSYIFVILFPHAQRESSSFLIQVKGWEIPWMYTYFFLQWLISVLFVSRHNFTPHKDVSNELILYLPYNCL